MAHDDPRYYIEQLVNHIDASKQKDNKKLKRDVPPLRTLLEGLKQYLNNSEYVL